MTPEQEMLEAAIRWQAEQEHPNADATSLRQAQQDIAKYLQIEPGEQAALLDRFQKAQQKAGQQKPEEAPVPVEEMVKRYINRTNWVGGFASERGDGNAKKDGGYDR